MNTSLSVEDEFTVNPLDLVEEFFSANEWAHHRNGDDEVCGEVVGLWCTYRLFFLWHEDQEALQFCCRLDEQVTPARRAAVDTLLARVNERMWLGHFDVAGDDAAPVFRHTALLRGTGGAGPELLEDLIEVALTECERFYPAFMAAIRGGQSADDAIAAAILDPVGEA